MSKEKKNEITVKGYYDKGRFAVGATCDQDPDDVKKYKVSYIVPKVFFTANGLCFDIHIKNFIAMCRCGEIEVAE